MADNNSELDILVRITNEAEAVIDGLLKQLGNLKDTADEVAGGPAGDGPIPPEWLKIVKQMEEALQGVANAAGSTIAGVQEFANGLSDSFRETADQIQSTDAATAEFLRGLADGLASANTNAESLINTLKGAPQDTTSALEGAVSRISAGRAEPGAAEKEKADLEALKKELEDFQKTATPASEAQAKFAEGSGLLERALNAGLLPMHQYQKGLGNLNHELVTAQDKHRDASLQTVLAAGATRGLGTAAGEAATGVRGLGGAIATLATLLPPQFKLLVTLAGLLLSVRIGLQQAAETQQLDTSLKALSLNTNIASGSIDTAVKNLEALNIASSTARETVLKLVNAEIDLANTTALGVAARDIAVAKGKSESEVLNAITQSVSFLNVRMLRQLQIVVDAESAYDKYADSINKSSKTLTKADKQQALLNEVLVQSAKFAGVAASAADNYNTVVERLKKTFNETLENAFKGALDGQTKLLKLTIEFVKTLGEALRLVTNLSVKFTGGLVSTVIDGWTFGLKKAGEALDTMSTGLEASLLNRELDQKRIARDAGLITKTEFEAIEKEIVAGREKLFGDLDKRLRGDAATPAVIAPTASGPSSEEIRASVERLIGTQAKARGGFKDLTDEGQQAIADLTNALTVHSSKMITDFAGVQNALKAAFAKQQTFDDFEAFLQRLKSILGRDTEAFRIFNQEVRFAQQAKLLEQMNTEMTAYLDATSKIVGLQKIWTETLQKGVEHDVAVRRLIAEIKNDQAALNALELQQFAIKSQVAASTFNDEQARINNNFREAISRGDLLAKSDAEALARKKEAEKKANQEQTANAKTYYDTLRQLQADYLTQYADSTKKIIELTKQQQLNAKNGEQLLKDIQRDGLNEQEKANAIRQDLFNSQEALKVAAAAGDKQRVKEEIDSIKAVAREFSNVQGKGDTQARREASDFVKVANDAQKQLDGIAINAEKTRQQGLADALGQVETEVARVQGLLLSLAANQITALVKTIIDPASLTAAVQSVQAAFNSTVAAFKVMVDQSSLNGVVQQIQAALLATPFAINVNTGGLNSGNSGQGELVGGFAGGGSVPGSYPGNNRDNVFGMLQSEEFVEPVRAVRYYGREFMESVRRLQFPRFAAGGEVGRFAAPQRNSKTTDRVELALSSEGQNIGSVFGPRDTITGVVRALKRITSR